MIKQRFLVQAGVLLLVLPWSANAQDTSALPLPQCKPVIRGVLWWINPQADAPHVVELMDSMGSVGMDLLWLVGPNDFLTDPDNAMLKRIYAEADRRKWRVIITTSFTGAWYQDWDIPALKKMERHNIETIARLYAHHPSFFGWYINYEIYMFWDEQSDKIRDIYRTIGQLTRQITPQAKLTISPFFLVNKDHIVGTYRYATPEEYGNWWTETIRQAGIDIVMLQDSGSLHSECVPTETRLAFFQAMQQACKANKAELWGNVEAVERRAKSYDEYAQKLKHHLETNTVYPWSFDIKRNAFKLDLASRFSTNIVSWGWEFWNPVLPQTDVDDARNNYHAYKEYYESVRRSAVHAQEYVCHWVSPEDFDVLGGWVIDTQFVDTVGSSYLLATGVLQPVADAKTTALIKSAGQYRIWARVRDWLPEYHPGKFEVVVNDVPLSKVLGEADSDEWRWVIAGDVALDVGAAKIALRDLTGSFGRCSAILLTTDMDYVPPHETAMYVQERARLEKIDQAPRDLGQFEVIVVGAGSAGCPAAIAAARMGARTALIQDRPMLGGNSSDELGVPLNGAAIHQVQARETGIVEQVERLRVYGDYHKTSEPFRILAEAEPSLTVFLNSRVTGVEMASPSRIAAVTGIDVHKGTHFKAEAKYVIDCTGDGWVGYYAGARYRLGREAQWEFNEKDAPEQPDRITMSGCLMDGTSLCFWAEDTKQPVEFKAPAWAAKVPDLVQMARTPKRVFTGTWWLEHPGDRDDLYDTEAARDELIRISFGYWDYIKNRWPERDQATNYALTTVPYLLAKRETRRLVGDHILTQNDVLDGKQFPDVIAYAGWPMDIHNPQGIFGGPEGPYYCNHRLADIRDLPYRCLYSANIDNLLFAGRCASVTHLALGTIRVQRTLATLGQAAGTAAALCCRYQCDPRKIGADHIEELQQALLKYDQYVPRVPNRDANDLARSATVTASSTANGVYPTADQQTPSQQYHDLSHHRRAMLVPVMHGKGVERVDVLLRSSCSEPVPVKLHLREAHAQDDFSSTTEIALAEAILPAKGEHWVTFELNAKPKTDYAWIWLEPVKDVAWPLTQQSFVQTRRAYATPTGDGADAWSIRPENYVCRFTPPIGARTDYQPANVINGWNRPIGHATNMWRSDPDQKMPQWIELTFPKPTAFDTVHVAFGTELSERRLKKTTDPDTGRDALAGMSEYEIQAYDSSGWHTLVKVTDNCQRWRRHQFDKTAATKLRLIIHEAAAMDSAQVYEIRVYQEGVLQDKNTR